jgi:DNA-binding protein HU-beta
MVASVASSLGVSKAEGKKAVDAAFAAITDAAAKGEEVSVSGFGKFKVLT